MQYPPHLYSAVWDKPALQLAVLHHRGVHFLGIANVLVAVQVLLPNERHGNWNMPSKAFVVILVQYVPVVLGRTLIRPRLGGGKKLCMQLARLCISQFSRVREGEDRYERL